MFSDLAGGLWPPFVDPKHCFCSICRNPWHDHREKPTGLHPRQTPDGYRYSSEPVQFWTSLVAQIEMRHRSEQIVTAAPELHTPISWGRTLKRSKSELSKATPKSRKHLAECGKISFEVSFLARHINRRSQTSPAFEATVRSVACGLLPEVRPIADELCFNAETPVVGGSGDCWRKLFHSDNHERLPTEMGLAMFCYMVQSTHQNHRNKFLVMCRQDDMDFHFELMADGKREYDGDDYLAKDYAEAGWIVVRAASAYEWFCTNVAGISSPKQCGQSYYDHFNQRAKRGDWKRGLLVGHNGAKTLLQDLKGTIHADAVMQEMVNPIMERLDAEKSLGNFAVAAELQEMLAAEGVNVPTQGSVEHAHGAHKTMETDLYRNVYPGFMKHDKVACFFTKKTKFAELSKLHRQFVSLHNVVLDAKDWSRYGPCKMPDDLDDADAILLWDVGQFLSPVNLALLFRRYPTIKRIYVASVYAVESARRYSSIRPAYYKLEYHGDQVVYAMEGTHQGAYEQPQNADWLFELSEATVKLQDCQVHFWHTPLQSSLTHHLTVSSREKLQVDREVWTVDTPDLMVIPQPWFKNLKPSELEGEQLVPRALYNDLLWYFAGCNPNKRSATDVALKIRNLRASPKHAHIRPETWRLLMQSTIAVGVVEHTTPIGNTLDKNMLAAAMGALKRKLLTQGMPDPWTIVRKVFNWLIPTLLPGWGALAYTVVTASYEVAVAENWSELGMVLGEKLLHHWLSPGVKVAMFIASGLWFGASFWAQWQDRQQISMHEEILTPRVHFTYRRRPMTFSATGKYDCAFLAKENTPIDDVIFAFMPRCPLCFVVSPSSKVCQACSTCPTHNTFDPDRKAFTRFPCCQLLVEAAEIELSHRQTVALLAEVEANVLAEGLAAEELVAMTEAEIQRISDRHYPEERHLTELEPKPVQEVNDEPIEAPRVARTRGGYNLARRLSEPERLTESRARVDKGKGKAVEQPVAVMPSIDEEEDLWADLDKPARDFCDDPTTSEGTIPSDSDSDSDSCSELSVGSVASKASTVSALGGSAPQNATAMTSFHVGNDDEPSGLISGPIQVSIADGVGGSGEHVPCNCREHMDSVAWKGRVWQECQGGMEHWGTTQGDTCHMCPDDPTLVSAFGQVQPLRDFKQIHEGFNYSPSEVSLPDHKNYTVPFGKTPRSVAPDTCLLTAIAAANPMSEQQIWDLGCDILPPCATVDVLPTPGLDERFLHAVYLAFGKSASITGAPRSAPGYAGKRTSTPDRYKFTKVAGVPHWEFIGRKDAVLRSFDESKVSNNQLLNSFLSSIDQYVDEFGNKVMGDWDDAMTDKKACKQLVREYKSGAFGTIKAREGKDYVVDATKKMDAEHEHHRSRPYKVRCISGAAGCGKSAPLKSYLKSKRTEFACKGVWFLSVARQLIRQDWHSSLDMGRGSYAINTFESALTRSARVLVVDEVSLLPPGYVDLVLILKPSISHVIVLGDTVQSKFSNPHKDTALNELPNEAVRVFAGRGVPYCFWTHRSCQVVANAWGVPTTSPVVGEVKVRNVIDPRFPIIASTNGEVDSLSLNGHSARNVGGAQGGTVHTAQVIVSAATLRQQTAGDFYSATSRVTHCLIIIESVGPGYYQLRQQRPEIMAVLGLGPPVDFLGMFSRELRGMPIKTLSGAQIKQIRQARLKSNGIQRASGQWVERGPPELQVLLAGQTYETAPENRACELQIAPTTNRTHLPRAHPDQILDEALQNLEHREARELITDLGMSELFTERPTQFNGGPTCELFPHQKGGDPVLFNVTVAKRLERGTPEENRADVKAQDWKAQLLFDCLAGYLEFSFDRVPFDPDLFERCIFENEFRKLTTKTQATLKNNAKRADPHWKLNFVDHFIKSQIKGKLETLGKPGKAGQTLATCQDAVVLLFGPMVRYLRAQVMHKFPPWLYCNCEKTNVDLSKFCREWWEDDKESTESDLTAFDSSQKGDSLGLECRLMSQYSLDEAWIDLFCQFDDSCKNLPELYEWWKTHIISSVIGSKATGRDTGEPGTYDFNTYFNLALTILMYNVPKRKALAVGGDDMSCNMRLEETKLWKRIKHKFLIVAKVEHTVRPSFCGYYLTAEGSFRNPRLLALKTMWHMDKGDSVAVDMNYASECHSAYVLGDSLYKYCTFAELESQGWLLEYYHQNYAWANRVFGSPDLQEALQMLRDTGPLIDFEELDADGLGKRARRTKRRQYGIQQALLNFVEKNEDFSF